MSLAPCPPPSDPVNLTRTPNRAEQRPSWSHDGQQIAYMGNAVTGRSEFDIFVMNPDGSSATNLTPNTPEWTHGEPAWSPDGSRIAFRSHRSSDGDLYTMRPDGSDVFQVTVGGFIDTNPAWSPDGARIVFARFMGGTNWALFIVNADGTGRRQLTSNEEGRATEPGWSPDGEWIVFAEGVLGGGGPAAFDLHMMRPDGSDRIQITHNETAGLPQWVP